MSGATNVRSSPSRRGIFQLSGHRGNETAQPCFEQPRRPQGAESKVLARGKRTVLADLNDGWIAVCWMIGKVAEKVCRASEYGVMLKQGN